MSSTMADYMIDGDRLWESLMEMASIGATDRGGVCRLALSKKDGVARDLFARWCQECGCTVVSDALGNMFARREGRDASRAPIVLGSHLDSQPTGGRYDGAYGVLAALEVVRTLRDRGLETLAPIEIVNWTNEEGARFSPVMLGSGTFVGVYTLDEARGRTDSDNTTLGAALDALGYAGNAPMGSDHPIAALLEVHIEQGPILEQEHKKIGAVTRAQGIAWYDIVVEGKEGHAGTTPMETRRDALLGAAEIVRTANELAQKHGPSARITIGELRVFPNARNTIPGRTTLAVDIRDPSSEQLKILDVRLRKAVRELSSRAGLDVYVERVSLTNPVEFDQDITEGIRKAASDANIKYMDMISGAGHDACHLASIVPTGLIFVPCKDGISHNEAESAKPEDLAAGCEVLYRVALEQAGIAAE